MIALLGVGKKGGSRHGLVRGGRLLETSLGRMGPVLCLFLSPALLP